MKGTDFLRDTSMLFFGNVGLSEIINKSGFAMIDMPMMVTTGDFFFISNFYVEARLVSGFIDDSDDFKYFFGNDVIFGIIICLRRVH